jgi:hypothetical protein
MQAPLIEVVNEDDALLLNSPDAEWYRILKHFPDESCCSVAAEYYDALYDFNKKQATRSNAREVCEEEKGQAAVRFLLDRPTVNKAGSVLYEEEYEMAQREIVSPHCIGPGITPDRAGGRKPKCFFALFKSFFGTTIMGYRAEPEEVHRVLTSNLSFARVCGFIPKGADEQYWFKYVPSLRKLEQFDQIMTDYGLWNKIKYDEVRKNIDGGLIKKETILVGDTTHYHAFSGFETVQYTDKDGKEKRKSQSKVTKNCRCEDRDNCSHPWELADDGAGTIVKKHNKYIWGHKASILGLPLQGIPLDAVAVADGATFDGETFLPHVAQLFDNVPMVKPWIDTVIYDSVCDNAKLKKDFETELHVKLRASLNPRRRKAVEDNLPRGMERLTPYGNLVCKGGHNMDYKGIRYENEKFIYAGPVDDNNVSVCHSCEHKPLCCPLSKKGRVATVSFEMLPHINVDDPPMAKRFKAMMTLRPSVERMIKRLKSDLGDDRLTKRGNGAFQAYLDKTMIGFHILLRS